MSSAATGTSQSWLEGVQIPDAFDLDTDDNIFGERQRSLLVSTLYTSWTPMRDGTARPYLALSKVGIFASPSRPPVVPDVLLSMDVDPPTDPMSREAVAYVVWEFGKFPDVVIEVVANRRGLELSDKRKRYDFHRIPNYVVFDPFHAVSATTLQVFQRGRDSVIPDGILYIEGVGLGLTLWQGEYLGMTATWLRWVDPHGRILPTSAERASRLAEKLRALGIDPDAP
jgi:hypothetical protein